MSVDGMRQLQARLTAVRKTPGPDFMRRIATEAVREQKLLVPRRTGNLGRSIHVAKVTRDSALTVASANYAPAVEFGTRAHTIRAVRKRALRWKDGSRIRFARWVRHPGTRAQPFMLPGARRALDRIGLRDIVVKRWNKAA